MHQAQGTLRGSLYFVTLNQTHMFKDISHIIVTPFLIPATDISEGEKPVWARGFQLQLNLETGGLMGMLGGGEAPIILTVREENLAKVVESLVSALCPDIKVRDEKNHKANMKDTTFQYSMFNPVNADSYISFSTGKRTEVLQDKVPADAEAE